MIDANPYKVLIASRVGSWVLALLLIFATNFALTQTYTDQLSLLSDDIFYPDSEYGGGVSFVDWNGDGLDDITLARFGQPPIIYQNTGTGFTAVEPIDDLILGETKAVTWVDYDNDGDKDLFFTRYEAPVKLYRNDCGQLSDVTVDAGFAENNYESFGASWGDYDNDGYLDVYISNYNTTDDIENEFYRNNGDGTFSDLTDQLGIGNGSQTTFCSLWWDYDQDGWLDLFVANDRDPFFNYLYDNDGGTFTDVSIEVGLYNNIWSMTTTPGDYDNDGDLDLLVTNAWSGQYLYEQEGGTFSNAATTSGIIDENFAWSAHWIDYNLDGLQDLYICYEPHTVLDGTNQMLINYGSVFLYDNSMGVDTWETESHSSAVGDWNDDGVFDIFAYNEWPNIAQFWSSESDGGNYLKVGLEGTISNRDGVGSFIKIWTDGDLQMRHTYCGEGYLSQNSSNEIFGLGDNTMVDSLKVEWPSGEITMMYDIESNQTIQIVEGGQMAISILEAEDVFLCGGGSLTYNLPGYACYEWSTGETGDLIVVDETADIWVIAEHANGSMFYSDTISVVTYLEPIIEVQSSNSSCVGEMNGMISLENTFGTGIESVIWSNEADSSAIENLAPGWYYYDLVDGLGCPASDSVFLATPDSLIVNVETTDVPCFGLAEGTFSYTVESSQGPVTGEWAGLNPDSLLAGEYELVFTDSAGCMLSVDIEISQPQQLSGEVSSTQIVDGFDCNYTADGGTPPITAEWSNGETGVQNLNLEEGPQWVTLTDSLGCEITIEFELIYIGIADREVAEAVLFPLPSDGKTLNVSSEKELSGIQIRALSGQLIQVWDFDQPTSSTMLVFENELATGIYVIIMVNAAGETRSQQFAVR